MDNTTRKFVDFAFELSASDLTPAAVHAVKRSVVDSIGCAIGAFDAEPIRSLRKVARRISCERPATILGTCDKTTPDMAALTNGAMIRYSDFSDDYFGGNGDTGPHPSDNIGGMIACAESEGCDGEALVLAIAIAYEVSGQLVDHTSLRVKGWDHPIFHSVASGLGAAKLFGLSREQMANAVGLAVVPNVCLYQTRMGDISNWKGMAGPNGSRNGIFAATLAREGITGPGEAFEGRAGFMQQLGNSFELGAFGGREVPYKVERTFFKYLPLRYEMQLPVWVALDLRNKLDVNNIAALSVYLEKRSIFTREQNPAHWDPKTRETADHSGPYLIAAALIDGAITEGTFMPRRFRDPEILSLVDKIQLKHDPAYTEAFPRTFHCRLEATLKSGEVVTTHLTNPKGHPANPLSDGDIEEKFMKQVAHQMQDARARALLEPLWRIESIKSVSEILDLIEIPRRR